MTLHHGLAAFITRMETARAVIAARRSDDPREALREIEHALELSKDPPLSSRELELLRSIQEQRARRALAAARDRSPLDLDRARREGLVEELATDLPKGAMLHVHLSGTLRPRDFEEIAAEVNPGWLPLRVSRRARGLGESELAFLRRYPPWTRFLGLGRRDRARLAALVELPPGPVDPARFEAVFRLVGLLEPRAQGSSAEPVMKRFLARCREHRLEHVEVTRSLPAERRIVARVTSAARRAAAAAGVSARLIWSFPRSTPLERLFREARNLARIDPPDEVAAADLVGEGAAGLLVPGIALRMGLARAPGCGPALPLVLHAGWNGDPEEVRDAMLLGARRIGHGLGLAADPALLEYAARAAVPVEACPLSNLRRGEVASLSAHPLLTFLRLGLPVSLATDDEGFLATDISREWAELIGATDLVYDEVRSLVMNSVRTCLLPEAARAHLAARVHGELAAFEDRWRPRIGSHCR